MQEVRGSVQGIDDPLQVSVLLPNGFFLGQESGAGQEFGQAFHQHLLRFAVHVADQAVQEFFFNLTGFDLTELCTEKNSGVPHGLIHLVGDGFPVKHKCVGL